MESIAYIPYDIEVKLKEEDMLFTLIPVGDVQPVLTTNRFGYGEAESGRFLFLVPLVETFEDMLAVERFGLPCVGDSQRVCLDRDTNVSFFLVMDKSVFQQVGDE